MFRRFRRGDQGRPEEVLGEPANVLPEHSDTAFKWVIDLDDAVYEMMTEHDLPDQTFDLLGSGFALVSEGERVDLTPEAFEAARAVAGVGYMCRRAESERFPEAGEEEAWERAEPVLEGALSDPDDRSGERRGLAEAAAWLVNHEPLDPDGDANMPSAAVPGIVADERRMLRERTMLMAVQVEDDGRITGSDGGEITGLGIDDLRRTWKFGFFVRTLEELAGRAGVSGPHAETGVTYSHAYPR